MREIKFRVFGKENQIMLDWEQMLSAGDLRDFLVHAHEEDEYYSTLMQFTGLYDQNGVEIYEGDVVTDDHNYYLVESKHGMFKPICYAMLDEKGSATGYEVIGNIYENPELLNRGGNINEYSNSRVSSGNIGGGKNSF